MSEPEFGNITLTARKLAGLVTVSNELLTFTGGGADQIIADDLIKVLATTEDINFLRGDGLEDSPVGLRNRAATANVTISNGTSSTNIEDDFKDLINALESADVPMDRLFWIMHPRSKNHLRNLRDANGNLIFPEVRQPSPVLYGLPVLTTTNIPTNLGGGNETEVYFVDASEVILGEVEAIRVEMSREAAYKTSGGSMVSAFQRDQSLIRAILHHDINVRHAEAVAVKTGVSWGA